MRAKHRWQGSAKRGFTLIEVLVVVAIIALLVAILMPSLSRAKAMAKMTQCQSNLHHLSSAFVQYSVETKGRLPGNLYDEYADWLGMSNRPNYSGRQPDQGTVFKYMGKARQAYHCPSYGEDDRDTEPAFTFNYCMNLPLGGAVVEQLTIAHYPLDNFENTNHRASATRRMAPFAGTPMLVEEDTVCNLTRTGSRDGSWAYSDAITQRHLRANGRGFGNLGYTDGHVGRIDLQPPPVALGDAGYFNAWDMCFRTRGGKWVNNYAGDYDGYGYMSRAKPASTRGYTH